ncbi:MAG: hypothetical protein MK211_00045 [Flavobacteriales bacterium]|nr:hypothetical protein [Candidatus Ulvibacter alkanivorans]MCH2488511.1 hypothetical protein [Flavobacteriales bacterium]
MKTLRSLLKQKECNKRWQQATLHGERDLLQAFGDPLIKRMQYKLH